MPADKGQEFTCSKGHDIYDPSGKMKKCPGYRFGSPCQGTLKAVGSGSRKINQKKEA